MDEITRPLPDDEDIELDEQLFYWIMKVEGLAQFISEGGEGETLLNDIIKLQKSMIERLRTMGGKWANRLP